MDVPIPRKDCVKGQVLILIGSLFPKMFEEQIRLDIMIQNGSMLTCLMTGALKWNTIKMFPAATGPDSFPSYKRSVA